MISILCQEANTIRQDKSSAIIVVNLAIFPGDMLKPDLEMLHQYNKRLLQLETPHKMHLTLVVYQNRMYLKRSSYVLSCNIYNTPVSFLVDMGVEVSLLNKEMWDKLRQAEDMLNPVVTQQIVGVNGMPIRIEGSVSVPVTIGKATFNHGFIVATEITAETILGLDFWSQKMCA